MTMREAKNTIYLLVGIILGIILGVCIIANTASAKQLPVKKQKRLERAMKVMCDLDTWDKYHVWPSNFAKHCWIESGMWENPRHGMNGHGEMSSKYYDTVEESVIGFCQLYNNKYFKKCTKPKYRKTANTQFLYVVNKGYCVPKDGYYYNGVRECEKYGWDKYDKKLKAKLKKRKEKRKHKQEVKQNRYKPYVLFYNPCLMGSNQIITDSELLPLDTTIQLGLTYYEVKETIDNYGNFIQIGNKHLCLKYLAQPVFLENIFLNCKG